MKCGVDCCEREGTRGVINGHEYCFCEVCRTAFLAGMAAGMELGMCIQRGFR